MAAGKLPKLLVFALGTIFGQLILAHNASAMTCDDLSAIAKTNDSITSACNDGSGRGMLWLNAEGDKTSANAYSGRANLVGKDTFACSNDATHTCAYVYLYGATTSGSSTAKGIAILSSAIAGHKDNNADTGKNSSNKVSYLSFAKTELSRDPISQTLNDPMEGVLDLTQFTSGRTPDGDGYISETVHVYRCWGNNTGTACYSSEMSIKVRPDPYNFKVTPEAKLSGMTYIGENIASTAEVSAAVGKSNSTYDKKSPDLSYQAVRFFLSSSNTGNNVGAKSDIDGGGSPAQAICNAYGAMSGSCKSISTAKNASSLDLGSVPNEDQYVGAKVCVAQAVNYNGEAFSFSAPTNDNTWKVSALSCIPVAKKPSVAITGNTLYAAGGIKTSLAYKGTTYGSWSEFLAITQNYGIKGLASGASLYNGSSKSKICELSPLSIANTKCQTNPDNVSKLDAGGVASSTSFLATIQRIFINDPAALKSTPSADNKITSATINHAPLYHGAKVIYSTSPVTITTDIKNTNPNLQIIIYAPQISIAASVEQIDAWLIATGLIDTCAEKNIGEISSTGDCSKRLVINGLIHAASLNLDRTAGADSNSTLSAEVINLTPASLVWGAQHSYTDFVNPTTVYTRELAPRM